MLTSMRDTIPSGGSVVADPCSLAATSGPVSLVANPSPIILLGRSTTAKQNAIQIERHENPRLLLGSFSHHFRFETATVLSRFHTKSRLIKISPEGAAAE
jgi:hypothetical protein